MCGIVGFIGAGDAKAAVLEGLRRLEYRGYDSCGIAVATPKGLELRRVVGGLDKLTSEVEDLPPASLAIGHTRWATHGAPTADNAHPHTDCHGRLAIVHNGVIENFSELKAGLKGHKFRSQTDTEVLAHLIESEFKGDLLAATRAALARVRGTYAILVHATQTPDALVFARNGAPLLVGLAQEGYVVASDATALLGRSRTVIYLHDGDVGRASRKELRIENLKQAGAVDRARSEVTWTPEQAEKGGFEHYMLKEMYEVPRAVRDTFTGRLQITPPLVTFEGLPPKTARQDLPRVRLLAAGTSYHAALIAKHWIESLARVPCEATLASEYRHSPPVEEKGTLAVAITQSGETADTLGALREAKRRGLPTLAISNVEGSTATREADHAILTKAGPEIGVAATKTYAAQLSALLMLAIDLGEATHRGDPTELRSAASNLKQVPYALDGVLEAREALRAIAGHLRRAGSCFFLGRGPNQASAAEGALKLKEIAYVHAEGYSSGELKHGPFALLTKKTPVVILLPKDGLEEKQIGTILEIRSRGSPVYGLALGPPEPWKEFCTGVVSLPEVAPVLSPLVLGLATHLLSYEVARLRGCPIDKPRNLAKSVTVE